MNSVGSTNLGTFESRDLDGAAQAILGLDYQVSDHFAIGGRYRYVWIQSGTTASDGFSPESLQRLDALPVLRRGGGFVLLTVR